MIYENFLGMFHRKPNDGHASGNLPFTCSLSMSMGLPGPDGGIENPCTPYGVDRLKK